MLPQILQKNRFGEFVDYLKAERRVVAPHANGPKFVFAEVDRPEDIRMDYDITILPPKKFLTPQRKDLLSFDGLGSASTAVDIKAPPTVILGVHPYDMHGIATLDAAFGKNPSDPYYLAHRAATIIIGLNIITHINEHQFMADMGTLEPPEGGFDLFLTDIGDRYFAEIGSEDGSRLLKDSGLFSSIVPKDYRAKQDYDRQKTANFTKKLPYHARYLPELLDQSYDSLLWDAVAQRCFSCGTCTNVCPTCYCFDVQDKLNMDVASGTRRRQWDSCHLAVFSEVAGGENFRKHRSSRLRHRMFRKGKYILAQTGRLGCVGCGRCSYHCVADISILEAFQQIAADQPAEV